MAFGQNVLFILFFLARKAFIIMYQYTMSPPLLMYWERSVSHSRGYVASLYIRVTLSLGYLTINHKKGFFSPSKTVVTSSISPDIALEFRLCFPGFSLILARHPGSDDNDEDDDAPNLPKQTSRYHPVQALRDVKVLCHERKGPLYHVLARAGPVRKEQVENVE